MEMLDRIGEFLAGSRSFYFYLALGGSVLFAIQLVMMLVGLGAEAPDAAGDFDASDVDMGGAGELSLVSFFSLRSLLAFVTFFGWAGFFWGGSGWAGFLIALVCGIFMMTLTTLLVWLFMKMQQSGNIGEADFVGREGSVYITIPEGGKGTVTVRFAHCTRAVRAVADREIPRGTVVKVVELIGADTYKVEPVS